MGKYTSLADFLKAQNAPSVIMSFAEIENVIGERLPEQAQMMRAWWRNETETNGVGQAWRDAGFTADIVDLEERRLVFRRDRADDVPTDWRWGKPIPLVDGHHPAYGWMTGTITVMPGVDLTEPACLEWADIAANKTL